MRVLLQKGQVFVPKKNRFFIAMAKAFLGLLGEFDSTSELFVSYWERLEQFFVANDVGMVAEDATEAVKVADQKKVAVIISVIGKKTLQYAA